MSIDDIDRTQLLQSFLVESLELLSEMEASLLALEITPDESEPVQAAFRAAHTIKGNAWFLELEGITEIAHHAEDLLHCVRKEGLEITPDLITLLLETVDALRDLLPRAVAGELGPDSQHRALIGRLSASVPDQERTAPPKGLTPQSQAQVGSATEPIASEGGSETRPQPALEPKGGQPDNGQRPVGSPRTLRVEVDRLDKILNLVGEITIARGRLNRALDKGDEHSRAEIAETHRESDLLYVDLQEQVMRIRMVPLGPLFRRYNRAVRDLSEGVGHRARLELVGEDVEVDMSVIEHLRDPLTHLVRNAIHHGIESPAERAAAGKEPTGVIRLSARHESGFIVIEIQDDGAGIDRQRVRSMARSQGLHERPEELEDAELLELIFEPGFTTASEVSELSGRGVGMDVVRRRVQALRGHVSVESEPGQGTRITLRLPLTLAILEGLSVGVSGEAYILPLEYVVECVELEVDDRRREDGCGVVTLRDQPLPYLYLRTFFNLPADGSERESVVVLQHQGQQIGLAVDHLIGETQAVIKPLGKLFQHLPALLGTTIMDDGKIAFVLDVPRLVERTVQEQITVAVE